VAHFLEQKLKTTFTISTMWFFFFPSNDVILLRTKSLHHLLSSPWRATLLDNQKQSCSEFASVLVVLFVGQCVVREAEGNILKERNIQVWQGFLRILLKHHVVIILLLVARKKLWLYYLFSLSDIIVNVVEKKSALLIAYHIFGFVGEHTRSRPFWVLV
jgi:hypothetical protein